MSVTVTRVTNGSITDAISKAVKNSNLALGVEIASQAKALVPVDLGQLRNSVSVSSLDQTSLLNNKGGEQAEALDTTGLTGSQVYVGSNSDHTIFQEYGTVYQPAQPFLRPSMEIKAKGSNVATIMTKYNREAMEEELKKRTTKVSTYG